MLSSVMEDQSEVEGAAKPMRPQSAPSERYSKTQDSPELTSSSTHVNARRPASATTHRSSNTRMRSKSVAYPHGLEEAIVPPNIIGRPRAKSMDLANTELPEEQLAELRNLTSARKKAASVAMELAVQAQPKTPRSREDSVAVLENLQQMDARLKQMEQFFVSSGEGEEDADDEDDEESLCSPLPEEVQLRAWLEMHPLRHTVDQQKLLDMYKAGSCEFTCEWQSVEEAFEVKLRIDREFTTVSQDVGFLGRKMQVCDCFQLSRVRIVC